MRKIFFKSMLLLCALIVGSGSAWATDVLSWSRSGTTDTYTTGYTFSATATSKSGYYQDASGTAGIKLYSTDDAICSSTPSSVTFIANIGGGTGNKSLSSSVYVCYIDNEGNVIDGTETEVTDYITTNTGDDYEISMPTSNATDAYGIYLYHTKELNYNVRYFSFSLSYEAGSNDPTINASSTSLSSFTYVKGNGPSPTKTVSVSGYNLTANISLEVSSNYEMCLNESGTYTNSLSLTPNNTGIVSETVIYVRLKSGLEAGDKNGTITLTSTGATNATVNLSGSVTTLGVTYDANGAGSGTVPTDATAYSYNATVTVLGNTGSLTKEHHAFGGWNTQNDGEGTNYSAGDKFDITANTTLYAKWIVNTNIVTLPANDEYGEYSMNKSNPVAYNTEVTLTYTPASGHEKYVATWSVNGTPISGNKFTMPDAAVTVTVSLNEVFDMTLSNSDIVSAGDAADGYGSKTITDSNDKTWNAYAIKKAHSSQTSSYHYLQIRAYDSSKKTAYYIQVPEYGRKITKLEMTVSSSSQPMTGGGNGATLFFSASNSTSGAGDGVASGTGSSKVTIDCSLLNLNTGYITAGGAVRIWDVKVTYDPIRLNEDGYATYAGLTPIDYSDDSEFSAWVVTGVTNNTINFSQVKGSVPAGTGVLLKGTAGQAVEPIVAASGTAPAQNKLVGCTTATNITTSTPDYENFYVLVNNNGTSEFQNIGDYVDAHNTLPIPAGRAYLNLTGVSNQSPDRLRIVFEDQNATNIESLKQSEETVKFFENGVLYIRRAGVVYDALGRAIR